MKQVIKLLAKVFNHKILEVRLLVMSWDVDLHEENPKPGYVNHAYSDHCL